MIDAQVLNDRGVVRSGTVAEYQKDPEFARKMTDQPEPATPFIRKRGSTKVMRGA